MPIKVGDAFREDIENQDQLKLLHHVTAKITFSFQWELFQTNDIGDLYLLRCRSRALSGGIF